jgi:hypothetical protein
MKNSMAMARAVLGFVVVSFVLSQVHAGARRKAYDRMRQLGAIRMPLFCPECLEPHIDRGEGAITAAPDPPLRVLRPPMAALKVEYGWRGNARQRCLDQPWPGDDRYPRLGVSGDRSIPSLATSSSLGCAHRPPERRALARATATLSGRSQRRGTPLQGDDTFLGGGAGDRAKGGEAAVSIDAQGGHLSVAAKLDV